MIYEKIITGKTVRLRTIEESDAAVTLAMRSDPEKTKYIHTTTGTVNDQLNFIRRERQSSDELMFVYEDLNGKLLGMRCLYHYKPEEKSLETGRYVGYGSQIQNIEALYLSYDFAFDYLKVDKIIMSTLVNNSNMQGIQKQFGAVETHRVRNEDFDCDSIYSVLTREAYQVTRLKIVALVDRFADR